MRTASNPAVISKVFCEVLKMAIEEISLEDAKRKSDALTVRLDSVMRQWQWRNHSADCDCDRCVLELARSVYNRLQNGHGGAAERFGVGSDTATGACHDLLDDTGARRMQPIGDFHAWARQASAVSREYRMAHVFRKVRGSFLRDRPGTHILEEDFGRRKASPAWVFMMKAQQHWNRLHMADGERFPASRFAEALQMLMIAWTRGLVMEGVIIDTMNAAIEKDEGVFGGFICNSFSKHGVVMDAPNEFECKDADAFIDVAYHGAKHRVWISIKSGRAFSASTIAQTRCQRGKDLPMLYVGTRLRYKLDLKPEELVMLTAGEAEREAKEWRAGRR